MNDDQKTTSQTQLLLRSCFLLLVLLFVYASVLFLSAGTINYWNAWLCLGEFFILELFFTFYLFIKQPGLLQKRVHWKEREKTQQYFNVLAYAVMIVSGMVVPGLDFRFHWSSIPDVVVILAAAIMFFGFIMEFMVIKQNVYASRTIEIQQDQKLVKSGFYSVIRHPMYLFGIIVFLSIPVILGSIYGFIFILLSVPPLFIVRILNEEKILADGLVGYEEYRKKVKYRLIPFVW